MGHAVKITAQNIIIKINALLLWKPALNGKISKQVNFKIHIHVFVLNNIR